MATEPEPLPPSAPLPLDDAPAPGSSFFDKAGPHAPMILLGASVVGLISVFLPLISVTIPGLSSSASVFQAWQGKLCLLGYLALGTLGGLVMGKVLVLQKPYGLGALITAGVVLLLALWILISAGDATSGLGAFSGSGVSISTGIGAYLNLLAAIAVTGAGVILAKGAKVF